MMQAKSVRLTFIACMLLLGVLGCNLSGKQNPNNLPVRSIRVIMDVEQRKELFKQLEKFADLHSLEYSIKLPSKDVSSYLIAIYGKDFKIIAGGDDSSPNVNQIAFYNQAATPIPQQQIDTLFTDLKGFLRKIPNAIVADEKSLSIFANSKQSDKIFLLFFARLKNFADQHALKFTMSSRTSPDQSLKYSDVEMVGDDGFRLTIETAQEAPKYMDVIFFIDVNDVSSTPASQQTVDELFKDINSFFAEYENVTVTQEP